MGQSPLEQGPVGAPGGGGLPITPGNVATTALWLRADQGITFGAMAAPVQNAGVAAAVAFTGVPAFGVTQSFEILIDGLGARGTATFTWSHNGVVQATGVLTAASVLLTDGVSVTFPVHVYAINDDWTSVPAVGTWTSIDASATAFSQATAADMPAWIAPGLVLTGWPASINGRAGLRFAGAQTLATAAFALAQPYMISFVVSSLLVGDQGYFESSGGPYAFTNSTSSLVWSEGASGYELYSEGTIESPFVGGFIYSGNASSFVGGIGPANTFATNALSGGLYLGSLSGGDFQTGDICEFWIDGEATSPSTWGQVRQGWVTRYGF